MAPKAFSESALDKMLRSEIVELCQEHGIEPNGVKLFLIQKILKQQLLSGCEPYSPVKDLKKMPRYRSSEYKAKNKFSRLLRSLP